MTRVCVAALFWICVLNSASAQVTVAGTTYGIDDSGKYQLLPGVKIQVFRDGGPVFPSPMISDPSGKFQLSIKEGTPFTVAFFTDPTRIPELQQLAGNDGARDQVSVVVLTLQAYQKLAQVKSVLPLKAKLGCLATSFPVGSEPWRITQQLMEKSFH
jgi:hypothetical protein